MLLLLCDPTVCEACLTHCGLCSKDGRQPAGMMCVTALQTPELHLLFGCCFGCSDCLVYVVGPGAVLDSVSTFAGLWCALFTSSKYC